MMGGVVSSNPVLIRSVFIGPPGCGKGTQAPLIKKRYCIAHLSSGDLLRAEIRSGSLFGKELEAILKSGQLVNDAIVISLINKRLQEESGAGFVLDGFPRTETQAIKLDDLLKNENNSINCAIQFNVKDSVLIRRNLGRLIHPKSGRSYHEEFYPPKVPMTDDITGEPLIRRSDDNKETLMKRMAVYHEQTEPMVKYYVAQGVHFQLNADQPAVDVFKDLIKIFEKVGAKSCVKDK